MKVRISYHIDGAFQHEGGIGIVEVKSMADFSFDRALKGEIDEAYLCQAYCYAVGTSFNPVVFIAYRKETSHICEVIFDRDAKERVVTQRLGGNPLLLAQDDPLLITEIRTPFDMSVAAKVREHFKLLRSLEIWRQTHTPEDDADYRLRLIPGVNVIEDETISVQGKEKMTEFLAVRNIDVAYATKSGSWWNIKTGRKILGFPCNFCAFKMRCFPNAQIQFHKGAPKWVIPGLAKDSYQATDTNLNPLRE